LHHWHLHLECLILLLWDLSSKRLEVLNLLVSLALLSVKHFIAFDVAHVAHVAHISEGKVVIEASLAGPVTNSLLDLLGGSWGFRCTARLLDINFFRFGVFRIFLKETFLFEFSSLWGRHGQVSWHAFAVIFGLRFFASVAFLSSLEVVVLALTAFPSSVWELEVILLFVEECFSFLDSFVGMEGVEGWGEVSLVKWLHTSSRSSDLSKFINLGNGWHLNLSLNLLEWWEIKLLRNLWEIFFSWLFEALVGVAFVLGADA